MNIKSLLDATSWSTKYVSYILFALAGLVTLFVAVFGIFMENHEIKYLAFQGIQVAIVGLVVYGIHHWSSFKLNKVGF